MGSYDIKNSVDNVFLSYLIEFFLALIILLLSVIGTRGVVLKDIVCGLHSMESTYIGEGYH